MIVIPTIILVGQVHNINGNLLAVPFKVPKFVIPKSEFKHTSYGIFIRSQILLGLVMRISHQGEKAHVVIRTNR